MAELTEDQFRRMLAEKGLRLDGKAFEIALAGARNLLEQAESLKRLAVRGGDDAA